MEKTNWETVFMFNRPNLVCSGYHGLVAHLQALPSISITTFSSIVGYCLSLLRLGKCPPNVTHLNGRMLFVGGGDGGLIPPLSMSRITMSCLYRIWSRAILVWFLCCFTSDIFHSLLLAFTLLNAAVAAGGVAAASSTAAGGVAAARANVAEIGN